MPQFEITINRKPWNIVATLLYKEAEYLITNAETIGLMHVHDIKQRLQDKMNTWSSAPGAALIKKVAEGLEISTWYGSDRWILGINKKNSSDGSALTIKRNIPEPKNTRV